MQQHPHRLRRAASSLLILLGLFVAVPFGLAAAARSRFGSANPLSNIPLPWQWDIGALSDTVSEPLRDDVVVNLLVRTSLTIIWLALAAVAITVLIEVVHMVRHRGMASPRIRGLGWAQRIARWIAVGLIALLPLNSFGSVATASQPSAGPVATAQRFVEPAVAAPLDLSTQDTPRSFGDERRSPITDADRTTSPELVATHTVQRGESIYGIAGDYANGDAQRTNEIADAILDLNLDEAMNDGNRFVNPALIQPGWELTLPPGVGTPAIENTPTASPGPLAEVPDAADFDPAAGDDDPTPVRGIPRIDASTTAPAGDDVDGHITHVVVQGDTLSDIAEEYLGDQNAWPEIWDGNAGDAMGGDRTFDDPNLILPGWEIDVPAPADAVPNVTPITTQESAPDAGPEARPDAAPDAGPDVTQPAQEPTVPTSDTVADAPRVDTPVPAMPTPEGPATSTVPAPAGSADQAGPGEQNESAPQAPSPIRIEHAALLAAGVLTLVGVRRRRALRSALPHARVPTPAPEIAAIERRLRSIDPGERAARVDIAVRAAAHRVAGTGTQVGSVRIAPDGEVIVRFTADAFLDAPWIGSDRSWTLPASVPIEMVSDDARQAGQPCLALVTVGIDDDGRDVLLDLEAAGLTLVEATARQGDDVVRAIGSGLATSLSSEVVHLLVAGLGIDVLFDHPNTRRVDGAAAAVDAAAQTVGSTLASERSAFDLRTKRTGGEMWEPAIILLAHGDDAANELQALPSTGHGIAAVAAVGPTAFDAAGRTSEVGARVCAHADGWELVAFDERVHVTPIGLTPDDIDDIGAILDDAALPVEIAPLVHVDLDDTVADPLVVIPHDIMVRLMGSVSVTDRAGNIASFERSKTVELIAWLATHRDRATRSAARTALWELDVRDATFANVVSEARRGLGRLVPPQEGEEWLARTLNESLPLDDRVVTDVDLIRQRVEHAKIAPPAHAIDVLKPAVAMIRDLPFSGTSYLWPDADGLTSNLVLLATTATAELAAHALSIGDTDLVFWATGQGLQVLPGHEELIGLRMRAHARTGDLAGVRQEWESYERVINADSWSDGEPAPKLLDLRRELLTAAT